MKKNIIILFLMVGIVTSCSKKEKPETVVQDFFEHVLKNEYEEALALSTPQMKEIIASWSMSIVNAISTNAEDADIVLESIEEKKESILNIKKFIKPICNVSGDKASCKFFFLISERAIELQKIDGNWRVSFPYISIFDVFLKQTKKRTEENVFYPFELLNYYSSNKKTISTEENEDKLKFEVNMYEPESVIEGFYRMLSGDVVSELCINSFLCDILGVEIVKIVFFSLYLSIEDNNETDNADFQFEHKDCLLIDNDRLKCKVIVNNVEQYVYVRRGEDSKWFIYNFEKK